MQFLGLGYNKIGDPGIIALADALGNGALPQLKELYLNSNSIGDIGIASLADALSKGALDHLQHLYLGNNKLSEQSNDQPRAAAALRVSGQVCAKGDDKATAVQFFDRAMEIARRLELPLELARSAWEKSRAVRDGDAELSRQLHEEACAIFDERGVPRPSDA